MALRQLFPTVMVYPTDAEIIDAPAEAASQPENATSFQKDQIVPRTSAKIVLELAEAITKSGKSVGMSYTLDGLCLN